MNAEEARGLSVGTDVSIATKWCRAIREIISIKASRGESNLDIDLNEPHDRVVNYVVNELKSSGYNVNSDQSALKISWLQPKEKPKVKDTAHVVTDDSPSYKRKFNQYAGSEQIGSSSRGV